MKYFHHPILILRNELNTLELTIEQLRTEICREVASYGNLLDKDDINKRRNLLQFYEERHLQIGTALEILEDQ